MVRATERQVGLGHLPALALILLAVALGGFSAFVGWNKAFAPLEVLAEHSAWTYHLPQVLGRMLGWLEMIAVGVLLLGLVVAPLARWGLWAAVWIALNHAVAAVVHVFHAEWHTLPQSAVMITLCLVLVALYRRRARLVSN